MLEKPQSPGDHRNDDQGKAQKAASRPGRSLKSRAVVMARKLSIRRRLEHLESLGRNQAGVSIGVQPDVTAAIAEYLESLREWCRSGAAEKAGRPVSGPSSAKNLGNSR